MSMVRVVPIWRRPLARAALVVPVAVACALLLAATPAQAATYDREEIISDDNFRDAGCLSAGDIQAFLDTQTGILKTYRCRDHNGVRKTAASIIYDAAKAWNLSPKVILCMLQKEQSLLTMANPDAERLRQAMGCGIYSGTTNTYPGFGSQVWNGARKLGYSYERTYPWTPGARKKVYGGIYIRPANASTWYLYTYNPSIHGNRVFWDVYLRHFGDPLGRPRFRPVFRFYNKLRHSYFYTASPKTRYNLSRQRTTWSYGGVAFSIDASSPFNVSPVWCLYNKGSGAYTYTGSSSSRSSLLAKGWIDKGIAFRASTKQRGGSPVWRLHHSGYRTYMFSASWSEAAHYIAAHGYHNEGAAFYLGTGPPDGK